MWRSLSLLAGLLYSVNCRMWVYREWSVDRLLLRISQDELDTVHDRLRCNTVQFVIYVPTFHGNTAASVFR